MSQTVTFKLYHVATKVPKRNDTVRTVLQPTEWLDWGTRQGLLSPCPVFPCSFHTRISLGPRVESPSLSGPIDRHDSKRLPIHIGSAGERARPPVQSFFVLDQMNRTEPIVFHSAALSKLQTQKQLPHLGRGTKRRSPSKGRHRLNRPVAGPLD
jgi:hypothetical protein